MRWAGRLQLTSTRGPRLFVRDFALPPAAAPPLNSSVLWFVACTVFGAAPGADAAAFVFFLADALPVNPA